ncbi:hypothetical protein PG997_002745 [Apiospora hydei]|uniref:AAA+ ATPase domain-containing protein n=1 Tax=Apiospora hydei TaxID=1337664 RepID=A0ABR1WXD8_9PEZI
MLQSRTERRILNVSGPEGFSERRFVKSPAWQYGAYTKWDGQWLGCILGKSIKLPPKPSHDLPQRWLIEYWFLQVHWPTDEIRVATNSVVIDQFDGEQLVTSLLIYAVEFHDANDDGGRKRKLTERGKRTCDVIWGDSRYMSYEGRCLDAARQHISGRIIVGGGKAGVEEKYPKHHWTFTWVEPNDVLKPGHPICAIKEIVHSKRTPTADQLLIISPCLSAFILSDNTWMPITTENIQPLNIPREIARPILEKHKLEALDALVDLQVYGSGSQATEGPRGRGSGTAILLHGAPGTGKSYTVEYISSRTRRPVLSIGAKDGLVGPGKGLDQSNTSALEFCRSFDTLEGLLFLTTNRVGILDEAISSRINLSIHLGNFDAKRRAKIWKSMTETFQRQNDKLVIRQDVGTLLQSLKEPSRIDGNDAIPVNYEHFKESMNMAWIWDEYLKKLHDGIDASKIALDEGIRDDTFKDNIALSRISSSPNDYVSPENPQLQGPRDQAPIPLTSLCHPTLNCVHWDTFQAAGSRTELFRNTQFFAVDVLIGEPVIKLATDPKGRPKRKNLAQRSATLSTSIPRASTLQKMGSDGNPSAEASLPERIRINSPALIKAFSEIMEESFTGAFLVFRPFRSLLYYEQELRDWALQQEKALENSKPAGMPIADSNDEENDDDTKRISAMAKLKEMQCLLSFIDSYMAKKRKYLMSDQCREISFADLPLLFNPGDIVIAKHLKQAYRVIKVDCTRHRVKNRDKGGLDFWKDETEAEFADNPIFVSCVYLDFDGTSIGPVPRIFAFPGFRGKKQVTSLPIYPIQHSRDVELRDNLVQRGKTFLKVAGIKHMHYTGLAMETRDEIDSQVVIDFEEAFTRFPQWMPRVRHIADCSPAKLLDSKANPSLDDEADETVGIYREAQKSLELPCVKECCTGEVVHRDEYVENRRMEDYIVAHMNEAGSVLPSVAVTPRALKDIDEHPTLTDEDFLIMSYRVFGFVLRSRKWHKLDLTHMSEVAILGDGEGFDQLVLPLVIAIWSSRGLILLLHGVPGVGKTSTAECVADSFRRPLFQITSGDLGTTAREVEDALEQNFNLASRWGCILLIDEADVFLGERTREDFVRNSLVAVFLRMMEYYSGVLFLTTNRVGVFDEAFTSRIHISLYYPPLQRDATRQIFEKNWERIKLRYKTNDRKLEIKESEITQFALDYFDNNKEGRWNGRQIRNAFQSAIALAELDALGTDDLLDDTDHGRTVVLGKKNFETVADAYKGFLDYLKQVYGADFARRARENLWRYDTFGMPKVPNALTTRLRVAEPGPPITTPPRAPPGSQPWATPAGSQPQAGYGYREPQHTPYYQAQPPPSQPQQYYPERYEHHPDQRSRYIPGQDPYAPPAPQDRFAPG